MSQVQIPAPPPAGQPRSKSLPLPGPQCPVTCGMGTDERLPHKAPENWAYSVRPPSGPELPRLGGGHLPEKPACAYKPASSQQPWWWGGGRGLEAGTPAREQPARSAELGAPRFSEKPPFHGLIEYLNNPFIPARHKECCPNSGDSGRRPRAQWPLEWGCYSGCLLLARSSG